MLAEVLEPIETRRGVLNVGDKVDIPESIATQLKHKIRLLEKGSVCSGAKIVNGELICLFPVDDLAPVIIDLTKDDLPKQKRLLCLHCQKYTSKSHFWNLALKWEVKTCSFESKGYPLEQAELLAAEELGLLAFMDELRAPQQ